MLVLKTPNMRAYSPASKSSYSLAATAAKKFYFNMHNVKKLLTGLPWLSSGWDSALTVGGAGFILVREQPPVGPLPSNYFSE